MPARESPTAKAVHQANRDDAAAWAAMRAALCPDADVDELKAEAVAQGSSLCRRESKRLFPDQSNVKSNVNEVSSPSCIIVAALVIALACDGSSPPMLLPSGVRLCRLLQ